MKLYEGYAGVKLTIQSTLPMVPMESQSDGDDEHTDDEDDGKPSEGAIQKASPAPKAGKGRSASTSGSTDVSRKLIRFRAVIHCTMAGKPTVDVPCEGDLSEAAVDTAAEDDTQDIPLWNPVSKVRLVILSPLRSASSYHAPLIRASAGLDLHECAASWPRPLRVRRRFTT